MLLHFIFLVGYLKSAINLSSLAPHYNQQLAIQLSSKQLPATCNQQPATCNQQPATTQQPAIQQLATSINCLLTPQNSLKAQRKFYICKAGTEGKA
jgi:hypothetical protein